MSINKNVGGHYNGDESAHHVILGSRVTEKTAFLSEKMNCVVFEVAINSNKVQIRRSVESAWSVRVLSVRTQTRVGRLRRRGASVGRTPDRKIAIVQLHHDDRLTFY